MTPTLLFGELDAERARAFLLFMALNQLPQIYLLSLFSLSLLKFTDVCGIIVN